MRLTSLVLVCASIGGCTSSHTLEPAMDERGASSLLDNPPEIYVNERGVRFRLVGPAPVGVAPLGGVPEPKTFADREPPPANPSVSELAEQLRPVLLMGGRWEYIGEEPAYELAEAILRGETMADAVAPREGRSIVGATCGSGSGPCDDRYHITGSDAALAGNRPTVFIEHGCSATMIDRSTAVTAAHCMYETGANHWYVLDGTSCWSSSESASNNTEDRRPWTPAQPQPPNTQNCMPRFAAAMSNTGAQLGWMSCYNVTIPSAFRDASSGSSTANQNDYAVVDFNTNFCDNDFPGDNTGWRGTWRAGATDFRNNNAQILGYPHRSRPGFPDNSQFAQGSAFPIRLSPSNCSLLGGRQGTESSSFIPCTSAMMVGATGGHGSIWINPMNNGNWEIGTSTLDTTTGQSGSGYLLLGSPTTNRTTPSTASNNYLVGIHRGACSSITWNCARAWDTTVSNFVSANSNFPTVN